MSAFTEELMRIAEAKKQSKIRSIICVFRPELRDGIIKIIPKLDISHLFTQLVPGTETVKQLVAAVKSKTLSDTMDKLVLKYDSLILFQKYLGQYEASRQYEIVLMLQKFRIEELFEALIDPRIKEEMESHEKEKFQMLFLTFKKHGIALQIF